MSETPKPAAVEQTFRNYTTDQGANYAQIRPDYHPDFYRSVIEHHTKSGGHLDTLLDVGCGPGTVTRGLAPKFSHAIGLDASKGMISHAQTLGPGSIRFDISTAEELGSKLSPPVPDASVDLITAATAAHWFNMDGFWRAAARVLKPGGTVAIWTMARGGIDPNTPNAAAIQAVWDEFEQRDLKDYIEPGNRMTKGLYIDMPLPWTLSPPVTEFEKSTFFRKEYGPDSENPGDEIVLFTKTEITMDDMEKMAGTGSAVDRWRKAHPEDAGTERDVVRRIRREIERLLQAGGVEKGKETLKRRVRGVLLMVKKAA